jgi:hypothetical protein
MQLIGNTKQNDYICVLKHICDIESTVLQLK